MTTPHRRTIKFRAWDTKDQRMFHPDFYDVASIFKLDRFVLMQSTGLKDKNGIEIYEGDFLDLSECWWNACGPAGYTSPIQPVVWNETHAGFYPFSNYDCDCGVDYEASNVEVIGNVYQNLLLDLIHAVLGNNNGKEIPCSTKD